MARPTSVTVFAICNIAFGAMTVLCAPVGLIALLPGGPGSKFLTADSASQAWNLFSYLAQVLLYLILLISGVGLLQLRGWGRRLAVGAGLGLGLFSVVDAVVTLLLQPRPDLAALPAGDPEAITGAAVMLGVYVATIATAALTMLYGLLMAVILRRPGVVAAFETNEAPALPTV